jgi:hypothetical protein
MELHLPFRHSSSAYRRGGVMATIAVLLLVPMIAFLAYPGGIVAFALFDLSFVAMLLLALPKPRSHLYIFFACMLFLGFWAKLMLHMISGENFIEPIGDFSGTAAEWEHALNVASMAAIGASLARVIQLSVSARTGTHSPALSAHAPRWYSHWHGTVWFSSLLAMLALNLLNFQFAFYQTGVNPTLVLPYHLNVPLGWLISIGFALWFAVLIHWEVQKSARSLAITLVVPVVESFVSTTSALSRSFYFLDKRSCSVLRTDADFARRAMGAMLRYEPRAGAIVAHPRLPPCLSTNFHLRLRGKKHFCATGAGRRCTRTIRNAYA